MAESDSYRDYTVSLFWAHVLSVGIILPLFFLTIGLHMLLWGFPFMEGGIGWGWTALLLILSIAVHELLHAVGFVYAGGASWSDVRFGVMWKALAPYAHCTQAMQAGPYRVAVALPALLLGVMPTLVGIATGIGALTFYGYIMLIAACGDAAILWAIRSVPEAALVKDHSSKVGCMVASESPHPATGVLQETEEENATGVRFLTMVLFTIGFAAGLVIGFTSLS